MKPLKTLLVLQLMLSAVVTADAQSGGEVTYTIHPDRPCQTIRHFGASDAWSMQQVGLWEEATQQQIADWLFSMESDPSGRPRGIGLSLWRFNLGAGSASQGDSAHINPSTRTECFLKEDGSYDFSLQAGQRRFLRLAKERGVPHFLAFLNSPPVWFTKNGLATNTGRDGTFNLREECYAPFARFMATALKGLEEHDGIHFDYLSPVNEPDGHWNWQGPKQEGTPATNRETARLARLTAEELARQGLDTRVTVNESSDLRCLLATHMTSWERGYTIRTLFSPDSTDTFLGATPGVLPAILAHSYWTNTPVPYMREIREQLRDTLRRYGAAYWQSELCIMQNDEEIGGGAHFDFTMRTALYVARVMHHDLKYADAESWSWWRACGGDYKDGLVRIYQRGQRARDSKLLWAMGNYSRFIRPGAVRHELSGEEDPYGLMATAYRNGDGRWVVVAINYGDSARPVKVGVEGSRHSKWSLYRTSDDEGDNLAPVGTCRDATTLPPRSITTFVGE